MSTEAAPPPTPTDPPPKPKMRQVNVRFPEDLIEALDTRRAEISPPGGPLISRDRWMAAAVRHALARHAPPPTTAPGRRTAPPRRIR